MCLWEALLQKYRNVDDHMQEEHAKACVNHWAKITSLISNVVPNIQLPQYSSPVSLCFCWNSVNKKTKVIAPCWMWRIKYTTAQVSKQTM